MNNGRNAMPSGAETSNLALFCDFENIALGVRDARYEKFDITRILERLLLKGSIVVKKAYCDWDRYKEFKPSMHHAGFELIEIPHVKQSGKNSADIRMVVDALDLSYTKTHVDTFVVISGDSDFSPLVSKLRENNKAVIGVGVKNSTSELLIANCDEFIYYDDLVREQTKARRTTRKKASTSESSHGHTTKEEDKKQEAFDLVLSTIDALVAERGAEAVLLRKKFEACQCTAIGRTIHANLNGSLGVLCAPTRASRAPSVARKCNVLLPVAPARVLTGRTFHVTAYFSRRIGACPTSASGC